jgi:spoIIIJ-associated protein
MSDEDAYTTPAEPKAALGELLEVIAESSGLEVQVRVHERDDELVGSFDGEEVGPLIGRRGQTIDAIQHLARRIVFKSGESSARVIVDADGYRERRERALCEEADEAADEAIEHGEAIELDPMPASERRVVHEHLRLRGDVRTHSEGEEPERFLVISPPGD